MAVCGGLGHIFSAVSLAEASRGQSLGPGQPPEQITSRESPDSGSRQGSGLKCKMIDGMLQLCASAGPCPFSPSRPARLRRPRPCQRDSPQTRGSFLHLDAIHPILDVQPMDVLVAVPMSVSVDVSIGVGRIHAVRHWWRRNVEVRCQVGKGLAQLLVEEVAVVLQPRCVSA